MRSINVSASIDADGPVSPAAVGVEKSEGSKDASAAAVAALAAAIKQQPGSPAASLLVPVEEIAEEVSRVIVALELIID